MTLSHSIPTYSEHPNIEYFIEELNCRTQSRGCNLFSFIAVPFRFTLVYSENLLLQSRGSQRSLRQSEKLLRC